MTAMGFAGRDGERKAVSRHFAGKAGRYEDIESNKNDEHAVALGFLVSQLDRLGIASVLDVGAGVGTDLLAIRSQAPGVRVVGIEPVEEMRAVGRSRGLGPEELMDGDVMRLPFPDKSFDCVCAFAVLHHVRDHASAVREMIRVARKAVFISDSNCFGSGSWAVRAVKQGAHALGLWPALDWVKSRGRGFYVSEGDGLFYAYSVFFDHAQLRRASSEVHLLSTKGAGRSPYRSASHVALLAILK